MRGYKGALWQVLLVVAGLLFGAGCHTWQAGRLYVSGTEALEAGHTARAVADLEAAAALAPHASEVQNNLGIAYLQAGRSEAALIAFERAVALDCSNPAAAANLRRLRGER